jgi:hypothetical protein
MAKKKVQTPEEIEALVQDSLNRAKKELQEYIHKGFIPQNPTRSFEIGERVEFGAHEHCVVIDKDETGLLYLIHCKYTSQKEGAFASKEKEHDSKHWMGWMDVFKLRTQEDWKNTPQFTVREDMRLQFHQSSISSFDTTVYHFGIDLEPDYQRGLVWTMEDKVKLIDSIFKGVDIGKFVFIRRDYSSDKHLYEILDGKQRLTTIMEFREDRFRYNGFLYSELHPFDQSHIDGYSISVADVSNPTKEQIYRYFLRLNTGGKPMDEAHLDKVKKLLHDEVEKKLNEKGS